MYDQIWCTSPQCFLKIFSPLPPFPPFNHYFRHFRKLVQIVLHCCSQLIQTQLKKTQNLLNIHCSHWQVIILKILGTRLCHNGKHNILFVFSGSTRYLAIHEMTAMTIGKGRQRRKQDRERTRKKNRCLDHWIYQLFIQLSLNYRF